MPFAMYVKQTQDEVANVATTGGNSTKQLNMSVQKAHKKLVHINERVAKDIAKNLDWRVMDNKPLNCAACAAGKAKQKSLKKVSALDPKDEKSGYWTYHDILTIKKNEKYPLPTNPNWRLIVVGTKLKN